MKHVEILAKLKPLTSDMGAWVVHFTRAAPGKAGADLRLISAGGGGARKV
jgi:hypothetical protein